MWSNRCRVEGSESHCSVSMSLMVSAAKHGWLRDGGSVDGHRALTAVRDKGEF